MDIKKRTKEELENRIKDLEDFISKKGVGSGYLQRAEKMQRNVNIALFLGATAFVVGLSVWMMAGKDEDDD